MTIIIIDPTVAGNVAAAVSQEAQRAALFALFGSADVTVRAMNGATLRETMTFGAWVFNNATPRGATLGALLARSVSSTGAPTHFVFRAGSTDVFSMTGAVSPGSADIVLAANIAVGPRTNLADASVARMTISADPTLPVTSAVATAFTLSLSTSIGTNGVAITVTVTPNGPIQTGGASVTLAASNGGTLGATSLSFTSGSTAAQSTTLTRAASGTSVVTMTNNIGLTNTGSGASFTSSSIPTLIITGPSGGLERSLSGLFTVTHTGTLTGPVTVTLSDGAAYVSGWDNVKFWPLDNGAVSGSAQLTLTLSPSTPSASFYYCPPSSGAKSITLTNDGGLTNPAALIYTATAYLAPSATPFRLVRGGSTVGSYATLQQCKDTGGWTTGDIIKCTGGTYVVYGINDPGNMTLITNSGGIQTGVLVDTAVIEWETPGNPMVLDTSRWWKTSMHGGGQPQNLTMGATCRNLTLRGVHIRGARTPFGSSYQGAAIWTAAGTDSETYTPRTLTVEYCKFWQCIDGIHTQTIHYGLSVYVRYSVFEDNSDTQGLRHDIYTGRNALTHVEGCTFRKTTGQGYPQLGMGHFIKSRCRATTIRGNLLVGYMDASGYGGVAQLINTPNGGVVEITGNTLLHYGYLSSGGAGEPLRFGDDQHTFTGNTNEDPSLTTHSLLFAQNTVRQYAQHTVGTLTEARVVSLYPGGNSFTTLLSGALVQVAAIATIRNNIVASDFTTRLSTFMGLYPDNSSVSKATIGDEGYYSGTPVAGSPAVNDATLEWVADFTPPAARADTNRGGRTAYVPSWVPTTAWQWTDVPGTNWGLQVKDDGTGSSGAPSSSAYPGSRAYSATWGSFNAPCYSAARHEIYMFGGGHADSVVNILTKYILNTNSPSVTVACQPTAASDVSTEFSSLSYPLADMHFATDAKPYSVHSYRNNFYFDALDLFLCVPLYAAAYPTSPGTPGTNITGPTTGAGGTPGTVATWSRNSGSWLSSTYFQTFPAGTETLPSAPSGPRFMAYDGSCIYYWRADRGLCKLDATTRMHSTIGGSTSGLQYYSRQADNGSGSALILGATSTTTWKARLVNLSTGSISAELTVSGSSLPSALTIVDLVYVPAHGYFVSVWVDNPAWGSTTASISTIVVATITLTSSTTATASIKPMTGTPPVRCGAYRGVFYDASYDCVLYACNYNELVKAIKVN